MVALSVLSYASFKPRIFFHDSGVHNNITSFNRDIQTDIMFICRTS